MVVFKHIWAMMLEYIYYVVYTKLLNFALKNIRFCAFNPCTKGFPSVIHPVAFVLSERVGRLIGRLAVPVGLPLQAALEKQIALSCKCGS